MIGYFSETGHVFGTANPGDAGFDIPVKSEVLVGRSPVAIPTGIYLDMPSDMYAQVVPRSSSAIKKGIGVCTGTIDSGYRGEISIVAYAINLGAESEGILVPAGDMIAQLIFCNLASVRMDQLAGRYQLSQSVRGSGGFGSTYSEFFYNGKVWTSDCTGAIAKIKRRGQAYNWTCNGSNGVTFTLSESISSCMRALGISDRYI